MYLVEEIAIFFLCGNPNPEEIPKKRENNDYKYAIYVRSMRYLSFLLRLLHLENILLIQIIRWWRDDAESDFRSSLDFHFLKKKYIQ